MGPGNGKACGVIVQDKREIARVTDGLGDEISNLQNGVERLFGILAPIIGPAEPNGDCGDTKEQEVTTPLGDVISGYTHSLRRTNDELSSLLRRIEL